MHVLVINSGSSSIKFKLYRADSATPVMSGDIGRIGEPGSYIQYKSGGGELLEGQPIPTHAAGLEAIMEALVDGSLGVISSLEEIAAVGHRVVHGGTHFTSSVLVDDSVVAELEASAALAPVHAAANLSGVVGMRGLLPEVPQVLVFDTAFHQTMPPEAYFYAIPHEYGAEHGMRRYGFHGSSYRYVSERAAALIGRPIEDLRMVVCHLGNGASMAAISGGRSVDTTMGFTPLDGLMMGTRSGDIDPGVVFYMRRHLGMNVDEIDEMLNKRSGLAGISGVGNDLRDIVQHAREGNERCQLAVEMYCYRIRKYIGAYAAVMGGIDAMVFTGGIGERSSLVRERACAGLEFLGIHIDSEANHGPAVGERSIDDGTAPVRVLVIPTDEEIVIVRDTLALAFGATARSAEQEVPRA